MLYSSPEISAPVPAPSIQSEAWEPRPAHLPHYSSDRARVSSMVFLLTIALVAGAAYLIVRAKPKEDRAGAREKRWWPRLKF